MKGVGVKGGKHITHINNFTLNYSKLSIIDFDNKGISIRRSFNLMLVPSSITAGIQYTTFFVISGLAQLFWVLPMVKNGVGFGMLLDLRVPLY